jgi:hypothetical protein
LASVSALWTEANGRILPGVPTAGTGGDMPMTITYCAATGRSAEGYATRQHESSPVNRRR